MNTYTALFPNGTRPPPFNTPEGPIGTMKLIDGIALSREKNGEHLILGSTKAYRFPLHKTNPPAIIRGYIFSCELDYTSRAADIVLTRSKTSKERRPNEERHPYLLRVITQCDMLTEKHGLVETREGKPRYVRVGEGRTGIGGNRYTIWTDALVILHIGDSLQIRPAGTVGPLEWVINYSEVGLLVETLERFTNT